jgi:hypothetical protein
LGSRRARSLGANSSILLLRPFESSQLRLTEAPLVVGPREFHDLRASRGRYRPRRVLCLVVDSTHIGCDR